MGIKMNRHTVLTFKTCLPLLCLLAACQPADVPPGTTQITTQSTTQNATPAGQPRLVYQPKASPYATIRTNDTGKGTQQVQISFTYPQPPGFKTQAFGCAEVASASIELSGASLSTPIYADGADPVTHRFGVGGCTVRATLSNVPYGDLILSMRLYDGAGFLLAGSELKGAVQMRTATNTLELSYRQTAAAQILERLRQGSIEDKFLAGQIDLAALQSKLDEIMQVSGSFPNYLFVNSPALLNLDALVSALRDNQGQPALLNATSPAYRQTPGSATLQLAGVLLNQSVELSLDDLLSANLQVNANGLVTLSNVPPGNWQLRLSGTDYNHQRVLVTVRDGAVSDLGTVTMMTTTPVLTSVTPAQSIVGSSVTLSGSHFNTHALANNVVRFGSTPAVVTAATATSLTVTVPPGFGARDLSVAVNAQTSATVSHEVIPNITGLSVATGSQGEQLDISGTGFDTGTVANNIVKLGSTSVTASAPSAGVLRVSVPANAAGPANATVKVGTQTSNAANFTLRPRISGLVAVDVIAGKAVLIRGATLTINGSNFDPTAANNTVSFGGTLVTAATANAAGTQLTVVVPDSLNVPGNVALTVTSNAVTSTAVDAIVPSVSLNVPDGGFF